ncbi:MAG: long-chain-fatty-acid--CoA ligase [Bryobacterales bacterium]|nr:long-chain-fatty-acid--CoA ligase [Bryobacterales bacterium]
MFIPLTPIRFLHRAMDLFGSQTGVVCGSREFTYSEFGERCERLAGALKARGIGRGDRVAYLSFNTHKLLEGYYGVILAGAIIMPLNVRLALQELAAILEHAEAKMLLFENDFAPLVEKLRELCPSIRTYVSLGEPAEPAELTYDQLLATARRDERLDIMQVEENSIAEIFYTSGSTGTPKGVMLSHRSLYLHALAIMPYTGGLEPTVDLHTIPLFHANGWGAPQASTMMGARHVMVRRFEPGLVCSLIEKQRATHMSLVPAMANALINHPGLNNYDLSSLRVIMIGGAAASPELIARMERALGCRSVMAGYGLSETCPVLTVAVDKPFVHFDNEAERLRRRAMTGWAVPNVELRVVDLNGNDVAKDGSSIGELITRSDHVMEGYYNDPEGTAAAMSGSWFHTGDMAVWDGTGYVHIVDRKKEIIISGGENISSLEVERAIFAHEDVFECAVVAAPDDKWGEVPVAIVTRKPGSGLTAEILLAFLQDRLGRFKLPRQIEILDEPLPKTGTGKIRKLQLREPFWEGKAKRVQG